MSEAIVQAVSQPDAGDSNQQMMSTGPSGLMLGFGNAGPVTLRLFRTQPTRVFAATPEYLMWLVAFRAMCLGAHLSVIVEDQRRWLMLADTVRGCGGTIDLLRGRDNIPGQGRAYRPSLIIDGVGAIQPTDRLGAWQSLITLGDPSGSRAVSDLRAADVALLAPLTTRSAEHLRRAYALSAAQVKAVTDLEESELVVAGVRRMTRVSVPPSPTEHRLLFGG